MNFEKVEIYGFKSFADKAEIKFGSGITGIVGPNGCGKSNVADAVRWVLGEQSPKTLRGSSMQDVIFSGTQDRKSLSYCEVSLFFDNSKKMFNIDYNEVIITRKLFRSGESEYYINKQLARLKDIVDLLHECGIGKEGYTIIGQGKVEEIMSAKPEDRRAIFEEATGISKFKTRKNESERKLDRTHENLVRYIDIISEIEKQIVPLEKQAEKAKQFNELSANLKLHELNTYIAKADGVETAKNKINVRIKGLNEQSNLYQSQFEDAQKEYDEIFASINETDKKLNDLHNELLEKRVAMEKSSGAKRLYEQKISFLTEQIERSKKEIEENEKLALECGENLSSLSNKIQQNRTLLQELTLKSDKVSGALRSVTEKLALGEELAAINTKKVIESIESLSDIKANKGAMSTEKNNLAAKLEELNQRLDELSIKREKLFNDKQKSDFDIDALDRAVYELKNSITKKEDEVKNGNEQTSKSENAIYSLNSAITTLVTRENFYKGLKDNYEGFMPSVKLLLNRAKENSELKKRIKGVVAELIKSEKKYDVALETALAASAQNVVTSNTEDAKYLIEYLKANRGGRITFLPISSVKPREQNPYITSALNERGALGVANKLVDYDPQYENVISNLLGNTLIVDTLDNATSIANKYRFAFKMVTLEGDVFSTQGAMTGGSRRQDTDGLLSNDRKLEEIAEELKEKRAEMDKLRLEKKEMEAKRDGALNELSILNERYQSKRQEVVVEREKLSVTESALSELGKEIESVDDLTAVVNEKLQKIDLDLQSVLSGSDKLEAQKGEATVNADKQQTETDQLKKERDALTEEGINLQVEITELKASISSMEAESERLTSSKSGAEESVKNLKESITGAEEIIESLRLDEEKVAFSKEEQETINAMRQKIEEIEQKKQGLKDKLGANDQKKQRCTDEINMVSEKKHSEEIALAKIDSDLEYLGQSIFEDYQETYDTAVKVKIDNYDASFGEAEITRLRRQRSALGDINANAIDDFKILKERYDEMLTQKEDLEKAEADLKEAIEKLKAEMLTKFDEGFLKINENFKRIFKELFGGGMAMLELDYSNAEDKLEAGVEIIAEPPGKKLQKLSLLSGGEKALTAIAILFSILKLRPMPFCVLDEIEAALDEANVDRFARYLKKFSEDTQFIVITHRKPTMELADALFGVTMEEKGVSKMVSVKLSDITVEDVS